ncbi:MAG: DUF2130 domain-containing protein [Methylococcales bacterium]|nr:DUF2130 domain-containing protein [Methylococcales bacterium]
MSQQRSNIACPQCGSQIDVNDILHHQIEAEIQKKYTNELTKKDAQYHQQHQNLLQQQTQLDEQRRQQDSIVQQRLQQETQTLKQQIKQQLDYEHAAQVGAFEQELATKSFELKAFNKAKADITRLQREKDEQKATIDADYSQRFNKRLKEKTAETRSQVKKEMEAQSSVQIEALHNELMLKSTELIEFNHAKSEIERLKREKNEQKEAIEAEASQRFNEQRKHDQQTFRDKITTEMKSELSGQLNELQQELAAKSNQLKDFNQAKSEIERLKREKEEQKNSIEAEAAQRFNEQFKQEQQVLRDKITTEMQSEMSGQVNNLEQQLVAKSEQLKELNQTKADLMRLKREKDEVRGEVVLEKEREFSEKLTEERLKIQRQTDENSELKYKEYQKQLDDQKQLIVEMNRKAEQGSMQMQGEVQELAIEEWLASHFPLDVIEEIKKGARGADCLQTVHTPIQQNCGTIYYESKRTKEFQASWIEKFKNDIREKNSTLGVLVTEAMPADMPRMGLREGVWVCSFEEFKGLSFVLRETVIKLSEALASQENKGEKMELLYHYLTSNEFKLQIEGIVEGFSQMQTDLDSEKRSMARIWKQREKQLQKVLLNTTHMYGSIKGIAGSSVASVALLELDNIARDEPDLKPAN